MQFVKYVETGAGDGKKNFSQRRKGAEDAELLFDIFIVFNNNCFNSEKNSLGLSNHTAVNI